MALSLSTDSRPLPLSPRLLGAGACVLLAVAAGVAVPRFGPAVLAFGLMGAALVIGTVRWPTLGLLGVLVLTSTAFTYGALPRVGTSGAALYAPEALIVLLLAWAASRKPALASGRPIAGLAIGAILVSTVLSVLVGVLFRGESLQENLTAARYMSLYGLYFVARAVCREPGRLRRLMLWLMAIGVVTAVFYDLLVLTPIKDVLSQYAWLSISVKDLYVGQGVDNISDGRVFMPGRALVQILFFPAVVATFTLPGGWLRRSMILCSILFGFTIVLIYTRAVWVTTLIALGLLIVVADRQQRARMTRLVWLMPVVISALAVILLYHGSTTTSWLDVVSQRFATVFTDNVNDQHLQDRFAEVSAVLDRTADNYITGAGFRASVGTQWVFDSSGQLVQTDVYTWHNGYSSLLLNVGLLGLGSFLALAALMIRYAWQVWQVRSADLFVWSCVAGLGLALVRILMNALTESNFTDSFTVPLIAVSIAVLELYVMRDREAVAG